MQSIQMSGGISAPARSFAVVALLLRIEAALVLAGSTFLFAQTGQPWWLYAVLFFVPDVGMLGYLSGPRLGALIYNAVHAYLAPALLGTVGLVTGQPVLVAVAAIWVAHIGFDRMLGYGLKLGTGFGDTHLGRIGKGDVRP